MERSSKTYSQDKDLEHERAIRMIIPAAILLESTTYHKQWPTEQWKQSNRMSLMIIKNSISVAIRGAIPDSENAKEYLSSVEEQFKGTSKAHASTLILKMLTTKYDGVSGVREHIMMLSDMTNKLKGMDMEISEGHISRDRMTRLVKDEVLPNLDFSDFEKCVECIKGKMTKGNKKGATRSTGLLELIHTDICGPFPSGIGGHKSFITFIDDYSRYMYLFLIIEKSESLEMFKTFKAEVENQLNRKIKVVRSDRGGEYYGRHTDVGQAPRSFFDFCKDHRIINQHTMPGTPQQNEVAERRNCTLKDMVRKRSKGYRFYCPSNSIRIVETRHAEFLENSKNSGSGSFRRIELQEARDETPIINVPIPINTPLDTSNDHLITQDHPNNIEEIEPNPEINVEPQETQQPLPRLQRNKKPTNFDDYYTYLNEADFNLGICNDPESFEDAITCDQSAH
ncbi:putative zinc finger, CCHC-type containing protein [Tanacetum coccineum]